MREAKITTDLDINNRDGWSILDLKMLTLSGVDSQHLPVFAAAVLQKLTLKFLTSVSGDHFLCREHQHVDRLFLCQSAGGEQRETNCTAEIPALLVVPALLAALTCLWD